MKDLKIKFRWETEFKETEIGEIPREWERSEIDSFMAIKSGKRPKEIKVYGFYEVWGANGFMGYTDATDYLENREVLITGRVGTLGNVYYIKKNSNVWLSDNVLILYPNDQGINLKFVFYHLLTRKEDIISLDVGSTQPLITQNGLKNLIIPLPPPPEQSRIATVLSWFDDLIEVKKRQNEILEKTAMAIFKSWFIDFEPFRDGEFVYSEELGKEIPKGWEVKKLGEVVKIESGGIAPQKEEYFIGGKNPFVRVKHLTNYPCVEEADFINDEAVKQYNLKLYNEGSIIFQRSGESLSFGRVNILPFNAYIVNHLAVIPNLPSNKLLMEFLFFILKNILIELIEERSGTALPYIKISDIEKKEILLPPSPILQSFHSLVEPLFQKIILNQKQIMTLRKIRDTLLPLLVFGKLRVEEV